MCEGLSADPEPEAEPSLPAPRDGSGAPGDPSARRPVALLPYSQTLRTISTQSRHSNKTKPKNPFPVFKAPLYDLKSKIFLKHNKPLQLGIKKKTKQNFKRQGTQCEFYIM